MHDLLNPHEDALARAAGWQLCHVYVAETRRWIVEVLPTASNPVQSAKHVQLRVVGRARNGDATALRALHLVMESHKPKAKRKAKS